jgi:uncharacterized protein YndB with AHSA1/START domain
MEKTKNGHAIYHDLTISTSAENVFEAITQPDHLGNWWPKKCSGKPKIGEIYNFYFTPEYDWYGQVVKCVHNKAFHIKMTKSDPDWDLTSFGFDLEDVEDLVKVKFWHKGWPECNAHFRRSSFCWAMLLNGLKNYVEKGIILPFEERE